MEAKVFISKRVSLSLGTEGLLSMDQRKHRDKVWQLERPAARERSGEIERKKKVSEKERER